jgi:hypothetical protein
VEVGIIMNQARICMVPPVLVSQVGIVEAGKGHQAKAANAII